MHVLQLANFYGPRTGGLRVALDELGRRYVAAGHQVTLVVPADADGIDSEDGRLVISLHSPAIPGTGGYRAIVDRRAVREVVDALRPDVIELSDKTTLASVATAGRRRGIPVVLVSHEHVDGVLSHVLPDAVPVSRLIRRFNRRLARRVDAVVCASEYAAEEFMAIAPRNVHRIPLGVDLDVFRPAPPGTARALDGPIELACIVRLSVEKCPDVVVDTVRELVARGLDVRLTMIGDGPMRAELELRAADLPVRFLGFVEDRQAIAALLASADAVIAPGPYETFGLGALEALACGTPLVVPASGALPELLASGAGVIAGRTATDFADALEKLLAGDRELQRHLARERAEQFTWETAADSFLALFQSLLRCEHSAGSRSSRRRSSRQPGGPVAERQLT